MRLEMMPRSNHLGKLEGSGANILPRYHGWKRLLREEMSYTLVMILICDTRTGVKLPARLKAVIFESESVGSKVIPHTHYGNTPAHASEPIVSVFWNMRYVIDEESLVWWDQHARCHARGNTKYVQATVRIRRSLHRICTFTSLHLERSHVVIVLSTVCSCTDAADSLVVFLPISLPVSLSCLSASGRQHLGADLRKHLRRLRFGVWQCRLRSCLLSLGLLGTL